MSIHIMYSPPNNIIQSGMISQRMRKLSCLTLIVPEILFLHLQKHSTP